MKIDSIMNRFDRKKLSFYLEILYYFCFIGAIILKCFYFQFFSGASIRPYTHIANIKMLLVSLAVLLMVSAFTMLFSRKRFLVLLILNLFLTLLLIADTFYYRYFNNAITIPVIFQIVLINSLGGSISNLFNIKDIALILDIPFFIAGLFVIKKLGVRPIKIFERAITTLAVVIGGIILYQLVVAQINTTMSRFDPTYTIKQRGIFCFHVIDTRVFLKENAFKNNSLTTEENKALTGFFDSLKSESRKPKSFNGIAKGKNIIVVQSEALQTFLINTQINGKEITPNLNKLIKESAYFDNIYFQAAAGKTADAEFITNNSLYPAKTGTAYFRFPSNTYRSMPKLLKSEGYGSYVFHAYDPGFYNRTVMYRTLGFDKFFSKTDFITDEKVGWGVSDKSFFRQCLDKLEGKSPFYAFMITLSSHYPFDFFKDYDFDVGKYEQTFFGNYIKGEHYADSALGSLVEELKKRGMYDNTILLIYGDHYGIPRLEAGSQLMEFSQKNFNAFEWTKYQRVPLIIHYPGLKNGETLNITGGQIDILPTLANLAGISAPDVMGKDLFNSQSGYVVIRDGSVITDNYMYLSETSTVNDIKTGQILDKSKYKKELETYQHELEVSDIILNKNVFKNKR